MNKLASNGIIKYPAIGDTTLTSIYSMSKYILDHRNSYEASQIGAYSIQKLLFSSKTPGSVNYFSYVIHGNYSAVHSGPLYSAIMADTLIKTIDLKTTATQDIADKINVSAYPNPFSNALTIRIELAESAKVSVDLCDYSGRIVKNILVHTPLITGDYIFPVEDSELPSGYYWLRIFKDEKVYYKAVVKIDP